jgi:hypothetical protein
VQIRKYYSLVKPKIFRLCGAGFAIFLLHGGARADPNDYVRELEIQEGEHEIETFLGAAARSPSGTPAANAGGIGFGVGLTSWWKSELAARFATASSHPFDAIEWDNVVRFADEGEWPVDIGALLEIERPRDSSLAWTAALGPAFQFETGRWQFNSSFVLARASGGQGAIPTHLRYQLQAKYREHERFEYGLQAFGTSASTDSSGNRIDATHRLGPAVFGRVKLSATTLKYNFGVLVGAARGAPDRTVRAQFEFEF